MNFIERIRHCGIRSAEPQPARSTSTKFVLYVVAPHGAERSSASTLAQPLVSAPSLPGVTQAPSLIETTPGAMRLLTFTRRPVERAASAVFIQTSSGSTRASSGWLSWIEWVRARDLGLHSISGNLASGFTGSIQVGMGGIWPRPYGSGLAASAREEISVLPERVV